MRGKTGWAVLGAMASSVPWAPVVAFMVTSPLTSPEEYVLSTGLFGMSFATTLFVAAIVIGLAAGALTSVIERTGVLAGQARVRPPEPALGPAVEKDSGCGCGAVPTASATRVSTAPDSDGPVALAMLERTDAACCTPVARSKPQQLGRALVANLRRLAMFFLAFAALGYLVIELVPTRFFVDYLGTCSFSSVPLPATLGIPVYLNSDGSLPMVASLMSGGMGTGAALAFLVTGAGKGVGAISGMLIIARWKVVALVIGSLWAGAVLLGYLAPLWL